MKTRTRLAATFLASVGLLAGGLVATPAANAAPTQSAATSSTMLYADVNGQAIVWQIKVSPVSNHKTTSVQVGTSKQSVPATWTIKDEGWGSVNGSTPNPVKHFGTKTVSFYQAQGFLLDFANSGHNIGAHEAYFANLNSFYSFYAKELKVSNSHGESVYLADQRAQLKSLRVKAVKADVVKAGEAVYTYVGLHKIHSNAGLSAARKVVKLSKSYSGSFALRARFYTVNMGDGPFQTYDIYVVIKDKTDKVAYQTVTNMGNFPGYVTQVKY